jgi:hypothetical protein
VVIYIGLSLETSLIFCTPFGIASSSIICRCHYSRLPFASTLHAAEFFVLQIKWEQSQEVIGMSLYATELHVVCRVYKVGRFCSNMFRVPSISADFLHHFQQHLLLKVESLSRPQGE